MEPIDELIPLTPEDSKILEADKTDSNLGCAVFPLLIFPVAVGGAWYFRGVSLWLSLILSVIALVCLVISTLIFRFGETDNKDVLLDIAEGKKRRIVAPIESKEVVEIVPKTTNYSYGHVPSATTKLIREYNKSNAPLDLKYSITVKEFNFPISEEENLTRYRKGSLVEFHVSPHSKTMLSPVGEIDQQDNFEE